MSKIFVFVFVRKKHSSYLLRKWDSSVKCFECSFIGTKAVAVIWADGGLVELLRCIMIKRKQRNRRKTLVKIFLLSVVMVFKTGCIFGHSWNEKCIFMYIRQVFLFRCWGQSQCAVCYGFSWQCCNGLKNKKIQKCVTISPEDARWSKTNCHCVVFNMDSVWMFLLFLGNVY